MPVRVEVPAATPPEAPAVMIPAAVHNSPAAPPALQPMTAPPPSQAAPAPTAAQAAPAPVQPPIPAPVRVAGPGDQASPVPFVPPPAPASPSAEKSDDNAQPVRLTADQIVHDRELGIVTAKGKVVVVQGGKTLTADVVSYNLKQDILTASGHVVMTEPTGEVTSADYFELTGDFKNGVAEQIRMIMVDHSRMTASSATRVGGTRTDFDNATYTACEPCREHPDRTPIWEIHAAQVTHNQSEQQIEYRNAWLDFIGVPVAYSPYISTPDPTVKRRSGLLTPTIGNNPSVGQYLITPYYWVLASDQDLTLAPRWLYGHFGQATTPGENVAESALQRVLLTGQHRWAGEDGEMSTAASLTADETTGVLRGHVDAQGQFNLDNTWRAGYLVQRQSDQTYSQVYNFPIISDRPWLTSRPYLEGFGERDYAVAEAFSFQSLTNDPGTADTRTTTVLPHFNYQHISSPGPWGDTWSVDSDMLAYNRVFGTSAERLAERVAWQVPYTSPLGDTYTLTTSMLGEAYHSDNAGPTGTADVGFATPANTGTVGSGDAARALPQVSLEYRFPFVNDSTFFPQEITPLMMVAGSPNISNNDRIPNEDAIHFQIDDTNVLRPDPMAGLDRGIGGMRGAYGLRWDGYPYRGGLVEMQVAQAWREHLDASLPTDSGFSRHLSDYVGHVQYAPAANVNLFDRLRLDRNSLGIQRQDAGLSFGPPALQVSTSYLYLEKSSPDDPLQLPRRHFFNTYLTTQFSRYWSLWGGMENNLDQSGPPLSWMGRIAYNDECFSIIANLTQATISNGDFVPGTTVTVNFVFKTLGQVPVANF